MNASPCVFPVFFCRATFLAAGVALALVRICAEEAGAPASSAKAEAAVASPFTNAIPHAVFRDLPEERDPFSPVGYVKPQPPKPGEETPPPKPVVDFAAYLVVTGVSASGAGAVATLAGGGIIEPGETYPIKNPEGGQIAEYKVISITEEKVVALFEGKEYSFKVRGADLERFIEKEDPNENKKP